MKNFSFDFVFTVRGDLKFPILMLLNSKTGLHQKIEYTELNCEGIPLDKRGFAGIKKKKNSIWTVCWNKIIKISIIDFKVEKIYESKFFSDLHGIDIVGENLFLANTNLDSIFKFNIKNETIDFIWNPLDKFPSRDMDYSKMKKNQTGFHKLHINSIAMKNSHFFVSYLGKPKDLRFKKFRKFFNLHKDRHGGLFVFDKNFSILKSICTEGLHDAFEINSSLAFTEYFSNKLFLINPITLNSTQIKLQFKNFSNKYLLRGGFQIDKKTIVLGYTLRRGENFDKFTLIRYYDLNGKFLNREIKIPKIVGIYEFAKI